jgi:hypothetical protein
MPPAFARGVVPHDAAAMGVPAIPNDAELAGGAIAESWFQGKLSCRTGVLPLGAKVRTRRGRSLTPDSSMKTMVRPSLAPFFYCRPTLLLPMQDRGCACLPRPFGRWQEKFNFLMSRHTPGSEYRLELIFAMSLAPRASVHRSVAYPCAKAPASSASTNRFFSASVSRGGR